MFLKTTLNKFSNLKQVANKLNVILFQSIFFKITQQKLAQYQNLQIYKNHRFSEIINNIVVNQALKYNFIVDNADSLYSYTQRILGRNISNYLVDATIGKVFTAGDNIKQIEQMFLKNENISYIYSYCSEPLKGKQNDEDVFYQLLIIIKFFDQNQDSFIESVMASSRNQNNNPFIAFKLGALINTQVFHKISKAEEKIQEFVKNDMTIQQIVQKLEKQGLYLKNDEIQDLLIKVLAKSNEQDLVTSFEWQFYIKAAYIYNDDLNSSKLVKHFNNLDTQEMKLFSKFQQRVKQIVDLAAQHKVRILLDAEQTYLQQAVFSFSDQLQEKVNNGTQSIIFITIQNYLKASAKRIDYEIYKSKHLNKTIALKMVRGAYMVEENKLSNKMGVESPICESFQDTSAMYDMNFQKLMNQKHGLHLSIMIASHNEGTIIMAQKAIEQNLNPNDQIEIMFAQLYGLSDHLTFDLADKGYKILKLVPYGRTEIMIPYLIRRAQEQRQMLSSSRLQSNLLMNELKRRYL